ncbi:MAG: cytochrome P450 [Hyphomicrobiales bacterium]
MRMPAPPRRRHRDGADGEPDRFDVARKTLGHVAFGNGIHVCVGMIIARLEAELLFSAFAKRVARFEGAGEPSWGRNNTLRAIGSLPVRVVRQ